MKFLERSFDKQNQWWKYLIVIVVGFIGGQLLGVLPLLYKIVSSGASFTDIAGNMNDFTVFGISKNLGLFLMGLPFVVSLIITVLLIRVFHKRTFAETINGTKKIRFGRIGTGFFMWFVLMMVPFVGDYLMNPDDFVLQFDIVKFIPLFFISILIIPLQSGYEEVLFRGYLTQGVAVLTRNRIVAILIPALIFALLHTPNPEVGEFGFWMAMPSYLFIGLLLGIIVVLDDGIELAIGIHIANNLSASLLVTYESSALQTDAVFKTLNVDPMKDLLLEMVFSAIAVIYFAYKYKWKFNVLLKKVEV